MKIPYNNPILCYQCLTLNVVEGTNTRLIDNKKHPFFRFIPRYFKSDQFSDLHLKVCLGYLKLVERYKTNYVKIFLIILIYLYQFTQIVHHKILHGC